VSFELERTQTSANCHERAQDPSSHNWDKPQELATKRENPQTDARLVAGIPASQPSRSRVGASDNLKIHQHFVTASTGSPARIRFSQPNFRFSRHFAEQTSSATAAVQAK
jgi:hypothetical protein